MQQWAAERAAGRSVGVYASDPITAAGVSALLPGAGLEPAPIGDMTLLDALLVVTYGIDERAEALIRSAGTRQLPVVRIYRRQQDDDGAPETLSIEPVADDDLREAGHRLIEALSYGASDESDRPFSPTRALSPLSAVEREVLRLLAEGHDTGEIAAALFYSERTVKNAISRAVRRLGAVNRSNAVAIAIKDDHL